MLSWYFLTAPARLVNGSAYAEGRVNVYNDVTMTWTPACASGWTRRNADVVCKQLGFMSGAADGELLAVT